MDSDVLVLGAGIAGATAGYFLSMDRAVTVLEMEDMPGRHATGRSAALFSEYYGNAVVRALTAASRPFFASPPSGFADHPLLSPRGVITLAPVGAEELFEQALGWARAAPGGAYELDPAGVRRLCPVVRPGWPARAMHKPAAMDVDVAAVHAGFLRGIRAGGGRLVTGARVTALRRHGGGWLAETTAGRFGAPVLVDAAGAWADELARLAGVRPLGLVPRRRTACLVDPDRLDTAPWPMVADVTETFYVKPESGRLLVSPVDAEPCPPGDVRPRDLDVAVGIDRVQQATTLAIRRVSHRWAGLRTAVADDTPVVGAAPDAPGFYWLAGLGGYGVQVAPAVGRVLAAAVRGEPAAGVPADAADAVTPGRLN